MSSGKTLYFFIRHIGNMITASGTKRIGYALANILLMGLGVASAYGFVYFINTLGDINFFASIMLLIFLAAFTIFFFIQGFLAQAILVVVAFIGLFPAEERGGNIVSFIIALLSLAALIVVLVIVL